MINEYKAWNQRKLQMVYSNEDCNQEYFEAAGNPVEMVNHLLSREDDVYIFLQFTGKKDINNVKLFLHDIVSDGPTNYLIEFVDCSFILSVLPKKTPSKHLSEAGSLIKIGDMYRNYDMLER